MSDDTGEPDEERIREIVREELDRGPSVSRRTALAGLAAAGGLGGLLGAAGTARAAPSWGSATGSVGTSTKPLSNVYSASVRAQTTTTDLLSINSVVAVATRSTNQSVSNATNTTVAFNNAPVEHTSVADVDTTTGKITVQKDGLYAVSGIVTWNSDTGWSTGDRIIAQIEAPSGTQVVTDEIPKQGTGVESRPMPLRVVSLTANDTILAEVYQASGSSKEIQGSTNKNNITVWRLG